MTYLKKKSFWTKLASNFRAGSSMEEDVLKFRAQGRPLQTSCFLIIPERILKDDDQNLARNIMIRSVRLIGLADRLWPIVNQRAQRGRSSDELYNIITKEISDVPTLGDTWVKMLMVCIDIC